MTPSLLSLLGDPRIDTLGKWWSARRFDMAVRLVLARRTRRPNGKAATLEQLAFDFATSEGMVRSWRGGDVACPLPKSLYFIDNVLRCELGDEWRALVDRELDEAGNSEDRDAHVSAAKEL